MLVLDAIANAAGAIFGPLVSMGTNWLAHKQRMQEVTQEAQVTAARNAQAAQIALAERAQAGEIEWDKIAATGMENSWKDEWLTILFSIPLVMCFFPGLVDYVVAGFAALDKTPDWYQWAIGVIIAASFGYRKIADIMTGMRGK